MAEVVIAHSPNHDIQDPSGHLIQITFTDCELLGMLRGLIIEQGEPGSGTGALRVKMKGCCAPVEP